LRRGKSIDIRYHSVREAEIRLKYIRSQDNIADILTKALGATALDNIRRKMGVIDLLGERPVCPRCN